MFVRGKCWPLFLRNKLLTPFQVRRIVQLGCDCSRFSFKRGRKRAAGEMSAGPSWELCGVLCALHSCVLHCNVHDLCCNTYRAAWLFADAVVVPVPCNVHMLTTCAATCACVDCLHVCCGSAATCSFLTPLPDSYADFVFVADGLFSGLREFFTDEKGLLLLVLLIGKLHTHPFVKSASFSLFFSLFLLGWKESTASYFHTRAYKTTLTYQHAHVYTRSITTLCRRTHT
jgi:hypothetical protein